jgi:DNA-binding transcriptional ArsR family regulator
MHTSHQPSDTVPIAAIMRTLADPTRRSLFEDIVNHGEASVVDLTQRNKVSQPAVSQHLRSLRDARLVAERRHGRNTLYRPDPSGFAPLIDWLDHYAVFWRDRVNALKDLLQEIDPK